MESSLSSMFSQMDAADEQLFDQLTASMADFGEGSMIHDANAMQQDRDNLISHRSVSIQAREHIVQRHCPYGWANEVKSAYHTGAQPPACQPGSAHQLMTYALADLTFKYDVLMHWWTRHIQQQCPQVCCSVC